jgi:hypothetical protein
MKSRETSTSRAIAGLDNQPGESRQPATKLGKRSQGGASLIDEASHRLIERILWGSFGRIRRCARGHRGCGSPELLAHRLTDGFDKCVELFFADAGRWCRSLVNCRKRESVRAQNKS